MRTNIVLDDELIQKAFECSEAKTKKELIHLALEEFVKRKKRLNLLSLEGKIEFRKNYNYKNLRK